MSRQAHRDLSFAAYGVHATIYSPMAIRFVDLRKDPEHLIPSMLTLDTEDNEAFIRRSMQNIYDLTVSSYPRRLWMTRDLDAARQKALAYRRLHSDRKIAADFHANAGVFVVPDFRTLLLAKQDGFKEMTS